MDWQDINLNDDFISGSVGTTRTEESFHIVISDGEILSIDDGQPWAPLSQAQYQYLGTKEISQHYLGKIEEIPIFVNEVDPESEEPEGYSFNNLWSFLGRIDETAFYLLGRAKQIVEWFQNHQFCGQCGKPTGGAEFDRSRKCHDCGNMYYPRLSPSIIVLVTKGEQVLLAKNAQARGNFYSTLAGFIEPGESIEEAVHREVFEEVGLKIKNLKYFSSQSWPFPNSLMLGFHAEYDSGNITIQEEEIADAQWFHFDDMPNKPAMVSISGWLIDAHIKQLAAKRD